MAKKAVSVTLDEANVLWLKGRARISGGNVSEALDQLITQARGGKAGHQGPFPTVVDMVDLKDDPDLLLADAAIRNLFEQYLAKPFEVNEDPPAGPRRRKKAK